MPSAVAGVFIPAVRKIEHLARSIFASDNHPRATPTLTELKCRRTSTTKPMATAADPAPPSRSYYEAYTKKQKAGNRFQDAVFVERGALRVARDQNKPPLPHLPTERKAIDRDEYARFLEAQLAAAGALLARFEQREEQVQRSIDNAARTCAEAAAARAPRRPRAWSGALLIWKRAWRPRRRI